jgi:hypothetical protein
MRGWRRVMDPTPTRISQFFQRHSRVMTLAGAGIVFVTFVVKEGMEAKLRNIIQSVDLTNQTISIQESIGNETQELLKLQTTANEILVHVRKQEPHPEKVDTTLEEMQYLSDIAAMYMADTDSFDSNTESAVQSIPTTEAEGRRKQAETSTSATKGYRDELSHYNSVMSILALAENNSNPEKLSERNTLNLKYKALVGQLKAPQATAQKRSQQALNDATNYRARLERQYKRYLDLSYGLYALGWLLSLGSLATSPHPNVGPSPQPSTS